MLAPKRVLQEGSKKVGKSFVTTLVNKHEYKESKIIPIIKDSLSLFSIPKSHNIFATFMSNKYPFIGEKLDKIVSPINNTTLFHGLELDHKCHKTLDAITILENLNEVFNMADSIASALDTTPDKDKESFYYKSVKNAEDTTPVNQDEPFETTKLINRIIKNISEIDIKKEVELFKNEIENIKNDLKELKDEVFSKSFTSEFNENDMELIVGSSQILKEKLHNFYEKVKSEFFISEFNAEISHKNAEKLLKTSLNKEYTLSNSKIM